MKIVYIALLLLSLLNTGCVNVIKEHQDARSVSFTADSFSFSRDGVFRGTYNGGLYQWRKATVEIRVQSGRLVNIELVETCDPGGENTNHHLLFDRVVNAQSLDVDSIAGATLTSLAYLKAVESAIIQSANDESQF